MKSLKHTALALGVTGFLLGTASLACADTVTDTTLDASYTATSSFVPGPGNVYDVFLTVDDTHFNAGSGFLSAVSLAYKTGSDVSTSVTLLEAPGGTAAWSTEVPGGVNSGGCDGNGASSGDVCFQNLSANDFVPATGVYTFEFAVKMPGTDALTASSDIKADYNTAMNSSGRNLGITSMAITIQQATTTPEPATLALIGLGLVAAGSGRKLLARAKRQ